MLPDPDRYGRRAQTLLLHVGMHKTGTSTLQYELLRRRRQLAAMGVLYPGLHKVRIGTWGRAHHALLHALFGEFGLASDIAGRLGRDPAEYSERAYLGIERQLRSGSFDRLILSSETFFRVVGPRRADAVGARLARLARETRVVCYVRHPASFALSSLSTNVQRADTWSFKRLRQVVQPLQSFAQLRATRIDVHPFARECLADGNIVSDFAQRYLPDAATVFAAGTRRDRNATLSAEAMHVAQEFVRKIGARHDRPMSRRHILFRLILPAADRSVPGFARPVLRPGLYEDFQRFSQGYDILRDKFDCEIPGVDYAILGQPTTLDIDALRNVEDFCEVDTGRRAALRRRLRAFFPR